MITKNIILSSAGLRNVIINASTEGNEFLFIAGKKKFSMNNIFAEFLSPTVSYYHHSDPTINSINIDNIFNKNFESFYQISTEIFSDEIIHFLHDLSRGFSISVNEEQSFKLRFASIFLGNEELHSKINENFPTNFSETNANLYLRNLQCFYQYPQLSNDYEFSEIIDFLSKNFYLLDKNELLKLNKSILFSIISNDHLTIENENILLDFINQIFKVKNHKNEDGDEKSIIEFYEKVEFSELSEQKFREFIDAFDISEMTNELWRKLNFCFFNDENKKNQNRYFHTEKTFEFDEKLNNSFDGIIHYLTAKCGGNVDEKNSVKVTSSSTYSDRYPKYVVDLEDDKHYFTSDCSQNSWVKLDFIDKKIRPNKYSIRTRSDSGKGGNHLKNWVIEGSNSDWGSEWKILDSRNEVTILDSANATCTFDIQNKLDENEYYRYIRIRQTGKNTYGSFFLNLCAIEFFGSLL